MVKKFKYNILYLTIFSVFGGLSIILYSYELSQFYWTVFTFTIWCLCILYIVLTTEKGIFSLASMYLLLLGIFHLGLVVPYYLSVELDYYPNWLSSPYLSTALAMCAAACSFYTAAVCFAQIKEKSKSKFNLIKKSKPKFCTRSIYPLFYGGLCLNLCGLALIIVGALHLGLHSMGYGESFDLKMSKDPRLFGTGFIFLFMGAIISVAASNKRRMPWVILITLLPAIPLFFYGFRGPVIVYFVSILLIWYNHDPKLVKKIAIVGFFSVMVLSPAVRVARNSTEHSLGNAFKDVHLLDFFTEAGASIRPLIGTIMEIEFYHSNYWWGGSYICGIYQIIPNISLTWRGQPDSKIKPPAHWITARTEPILYARGGGLGYSGVAEPYLNFGVPGVIFFFSGLGYFLIKLERKFHEDPYKIAVLMCSYAALLWTTRNDFVNFFRPAIWACIFILFLRLMASRKILFRGSHR
jgi:oligosaccharide repeat unit polymerase